MRKVYLRFFRVDVVEFIYVERRWRCIDGGVCFIRGVNCSDYRCLFWFKEVIKV